MNKLDSMWWHEAPENGKLASSHIAILFCALVRSGMIVNDLLEMEFEGIPNTFDDEKLSPMDYCIAYTDGEFMAEYIRPKYRNQLTDLYQSEEIFKILTETNGLEHDTSNETYILKCTWHNVRVIEKWLQIGISPK